MHHSYSGAMVLVRLGGGGGVAMGKLKGAYLRANFIRSHSRSTEVTATDLFMKTKPDFRIGFFLSSHIYVQLYIVSISQCVVVQSLKYKIEVRNLALRAVYYTGRIYT